MNEPTDNSPPTNRESALTQRVRTLRLPPDLTAGARPRPWLPWALCGVLAVATMVFAFRGGRTGDDPSKTAKSGLPPASSAVAGSGAVVLEAKGYIIPAHQIQISPKVSGMVIELNIEEGMQVKRGDILAKIEAVEYQADRDRSAANLDLAWSHFLEFYTGSRPEEIKQAKAELDEAEALREQYYLDWKRNQALNRQSLSPREYEQAFSSYKSADRRVEKLRQSHALMVEGPRTEKIDAAWAEVGQAAADLARSQWRLDNCTILAPVTGTILLKKAEQFNIVNPVAFNVSASLCEMADLSDLEIDLSIQERDIASVFKGQKCKIRSEAFPEREYDGEVSRLMPSADRAKGAIPVRVKLRVPREEEGKYLKPEMSVLVSFMKQ